MDNKNISCPVDFVQVNENKTRITALLIALLATAYLFTGLWAIPLFLLIDFFIRVFYNVKYSPLHIISDYAVARFSIPNKPTDSAPKRFAALMGFVISDLIFLFQLLQLEQLSFYLAILLLVFSCLENFFGFCAGCHVHTFLKKFSRPNKLNEVVVL